MKSMSSSALSAALATENLENLLRPHLNSLYSDTTNVLEFSNFLYQGCVVTKVQLEACMSVETDFERCHELYKIIFQKNSSQVMVTALSHSGNEHILKIVQNCVQQRKLETSGPVNDLTTSMSAASVESTTEFITKPSPQLDQKLKRLMDYKNLLKFNELSKDFEMENQIAVRILHVNGVAFDLGMHRKADWATFLEGRVVAAQEYTDVGHITAIYLNSVDFDPPKLLKLLLDCRQNLETIWLRNVDKTIFESTSCWTQDPKIQEFKTSQPTIGLKIFPYLTSFSCHLNVTSLILPTGVIDQILFFFNNQQRQGDQNHFDDLWSINCRIEISINNFILFLLDSMGDNGKRTFLLNCVDMGANSIEGLIAEGGSNLKSLFLNLNRSPSGVSMSLFPSGITRLAVPFELFWAGWGQPHWVNPLARLTQLETLVLFEFNLDSSKPHFSLENLSQAQRLRAICLRGSKIEFKPGFNFGDSVTIVRFYSCIFSKQLIQVRQTGICKDIPSSFLMQRKISEDHFETSTPPFMDYGYLWHEL